jgi:hypothetical protein
MTANPQSRRGGGLHTFAISDFTKYRRQPVRSENVSSSAILAMSIQGRSRRGGLYCAERYDGPEQAEQPRVPAYESEGEMTHTLARKRKNYHLERIGSGFCFSMQPNSTWRLRDELSKS